MATTTSNRTPNPAYTVCEGTTPIDKAVTDKLHDDLVRPTKGLKSQNGNAANVFAMGAYAAGRNDDGRLYTPAMEQATEFVNWTIDRKLQHAASTFTGKTVPDFIEHAAMTMPIIVSAQATETERAQAARIAELEAELAAKPTSKDDASIEE